MFQITVLSPSRAKLIDPPKELDGYLCSDFIHPSTIPDFQDLYPGVTVVYKYYKKKLKSPKKPKVMNPKLKKLFDLVDTHLQDLNLSELVVLTTLVNYEKTFGGLSPVQYKLLYNLVHYPAFKTIRKITELMKFQAYLTAGELTILRKWDERYSLKTSFNIHAIYARLRRTLHKEVSNHE